MTTEKLEQALLKAKWGNAEENAVEVIARMFDLPIEAVERVLYAAHLIRKKNDTHATIRPMDVGASLSAELQDAIKTNLNEGLARTRIRWAIQNEKPVRIYVHHLIKKPEEICNGCPVSLRCIAEDLSTPEKCFTAGPPIGIKEVAVTSQTTPIGSRTHFERQYGGAALVYPVNLKGNRVTATGTHPRGRFTFNAEDIET